MARAEFQRRIENAEEFVSRCSTARHATASRSALSRPHVQLAYEAATLKIVVASEQFLETSLGLYVLGTRSPSGFRVRRLHPLRGSLATVLALFRGDKNYVGWNSPTVVISRASRWLRNGEPFQTPLSAASQLLTYLRRMRNVIAHESDSAYDDYVDATRRIYGALPPVVSPGHQLMSPPPPAIPSIGAGPLFTTIVATYRSIATAVVP